MSIPKAAVGCIISNIWKLDTRESYSYQFCIFNLSQWVSLIVLLTLADQFIFRMASRRLAVVMKPEVCLRTALRG